ncbi:RCC1 domain-containing protein [Rhabdothermincola sediminis]|uniref:RCC1 domain-containing protein n=2 Tax=Rhabdothermincola sediminis TaxID=2751370 RepID=UPI001AA08496|nr:Calx-beta domain-containing protein [Rhabdothermincola sediminis]
MTAPHDHPHPRRSRATRRVALALTALLVAGLAALAPGSPAQASGPAVASVGDVSVVEGDTGTRVVKVPVTLTNPATTASTVAFAVTAGSADGTDLVLRTGTLKFTPNITGETKTAGAIAVKITGDTTVEGDETFTVTLTGATGGITLGDTTGVGTIVDDDPGPGGPVVSVADTTIVEGDTARTPTTTNNVAVAVTLSEPAPGPLDVVATVAAGTATTGADFKKAYTKTVTFKPGQTTKAVSVGVLPDTTPEADETVTVTLTSPSPGLTIGAATATVTIRDDDTPPTSGTLWAWGYNGDGQLGTGDTTDQTSPVQIGTGTDWASVTAGDSHTVAIRTDGTLWAWGRNGYGQLGTGDTTNRTSPVQIGTGTDWASVTAGYYHTVAVRTDGTLWAWGWNLFGQLGTGDTTNRTSPVQIGTGTDWASVTAGYSHTVAIRTDGTLWAWGYNSDGQLGTGDYTSHASPVQIGTGTDWASVTTSYLHTVAVRTV